MTSSTVLTPFMPPDPTGGAPLANGAASPTCQPQVMVVTPQIAQGWADRNTSNRPIRYNKVASMARDMKGGRWRLNGQTIKICTDGTIIDGQHRIYACIQSCVSFETVVVTGLPLDVQDTVDTGTARTMADQLALHGEKNAAITAAVARWAYKWLHGARSKVGSADEPTHSEINALLEAEPRIREAAEWASAARGSFKSVQGSVYGMAWLLFHGSDHLAAEVFLEKVRTGIELPAKHPALAFRNRIYKARDTGERLTAHEQLCLFVYAWNAFQEDRQIERLQFPKGGLTPRNFPEVK